MPDEDQDILNIWQPTCPIPLNREDAREIKVNVVAFIDLLSRWQKLDAVAQPPP